MDRMKSAQLHDWNDFKKIFGTSTSTNFDLIRWAKYLKIKPFYYAMRDEIKDLPNYGNFMTNIHTSKERGVHHSAIYSDVSKVYFFDSYALPPTLEIIQKFDHTDNRICGDMALFFLHRINKGDSYEDILQQLK
jgi:hypothetical protein